MTQITLTSTFEIKTSKSDAVLKSSMKKVFQMLFALDHKRSYEAFITDTTGREFLFSFNRTSWGFMLDCENADDEHDTYAKYEVFWMNDQHRAVDYEEAWYEVEKVF